MTDDVRFAAPSTLGGVIVTRALDRIASAWLRYTNFHPDGGRQFRIRDCPAGGEQTQASNLNTPLDWVGVTDHSEYAGVVNLANEPGSAVSKIPAAQPLVLKARTNEEMTRVALYAINTLASEPPVKALMAPEITGAVWKRNGEVHEKVYDVVWGDADKRKPGADGKMPPGARLHLAHLVHACPEPGRRAGEVRESPLF